MFTNTRLAISLLLIFFASNTLADRQETVTGGWRSPLITAAAVDEKVRFSAPGGIAQIRVQILSLSGDSLFDSAWKDGNVLDWSPGQPIANGSYRCVVAVKDLEGQVTQKEATVIAQGGQLVIEQRAGAEGLTIVGPDENGPKITLLVHDGANGAIVSTSGDLSFRFGNFLAGKESERMRLTADGNLGIGTDKPQAPLDVNGLIRTSKGIMFPDGTILTTAAGLPGVEEGESVIRQRPSASSGTPGITKSGFELRSQPPSVTPNRLTPRPTAADYQFKVDGLGVHIGTTNAYGLDVAGNVNLSSNLALPSTASGGTAGVIKLGGFPFAHNFGGSNNTFVGPTAGNFTMSGQYITAIGSAALQNNTTGEKNTASGYLALGQNTTGSNNVASGYYALIANTMGDFNTASGVQALQNNTTGFWNTGTGASALQNNGAGARNTANGVLALFSNTGNDNTAIGVRALENNTIGSGNIALGFFAGQNLTTGSNNIDIGTNPGVAGESNTIRIGLGHTKAFLAGVRGVTTDVADGLTVLIDSAGQLGTVSSSARVKREIADIGGASSALLKLRPVSFFYHHDAVGIRQYGLIAEEVAEVMPELVQFSAAGEAETVRYHFLAPLLLNELQKQQRTIEKLHQTIEELTTQQNLISELQRENRALEQRMRKLESAVAAQVSLTQQ